MTAPVYISVDNLSSAWLDTTLALASLPDRKAFHTVTRIGEVGTENLRIRAAGDSLLGELDLPGVETVANTIFPQAMAAQTPDVEALTARYLAIYPELARLRPSVNGKGTYFQRLINYPGGADGFNQLAFIINTLRLETADRGEERRTGPKSARYEASLEIPGDSDDDDAPEPLEDDEGYTSAAPTFAPGRDTSAMAFPCLSFLSFQLEQGERLHAVAHYRSQYLVRRGYGNYLGLSRLIQYIAGQADLVPGSLTVIAGRAHGDQLNRVRIGRLQELQTTLRRDGQ